MAMLSGRKKKYFLRCSSFHQEMLPLQGHGGQDEFGTWGPFNSSPISDTLTGALGAKL